MVWACIKTSNKRSYLEVRSGLSIKYASMISSGRLRQFLNTRIRGFELPPRVFEYVFPPCCLEVIDSQVINVWKVKIFFLQYIQ